MRRILILDSDHPLRLHLVEALRKTANTEVVLADDGTDFMGKVLTQSFAGVFADTSLLGEQAQGIMAAIRSIATRPLIILASNHDPGELDPDLISLVVRKPYDVPLVTGILLAAVLETPPAADGAADQGRDFDA